MRRIINLLKVSINRKFKLAFKYLFKRADIILLIKHQHRFFIFN